MIADRSSSSIEQLNLDNRRGECGCWTQAKNKFSTFSSLDSSRSSSELNSEPNSEPNSDASSLKMHHSDQSDQLNGQSNASQTERAGDRSDQLIQLSSTNQRRQINPMNHLNHFNHLGHPMAKQLGELDLHFDDCEQFFVPIESYEVLDKRTKFTIYKLKVENLRSGLYWYVYRRFTDFQRLNAKLSSKYPHLDLSLPGKSLSALFENTFSPMFIEKRQADLQLYLNQLMSSRQLLSDLTVRRFLCIDEPPMSSLANDTLTYPPSVYPPSVYSDSSCDQLFACNNCYALEKKLGQMQSLLDEREAKIKSLESALEKKNGSTERY